MQQATGTPGGVVTKPKPYTTLAFRLASHSAPAKIAFLVGPGHCAREYDFSRFLDPAEVNVAERIGNEKGT